MESAFEIYMSVTFVQNYRSYWKYKISRCIILGTLWDELGFQTSTSMLLSLDWLNCVRTFLLDQANNVLSI